MSSIKKSTLLQVRSDKSLPYWL